MARVKLLFLLAAAMLLMVLMLLPALNTAVQAEPAITPTMIAKEWAFLPMVRGFAKGPTATPLPPVPTRTASPTLTTTPEFTPTSTSTPTMTSTPEPTNTPTATPTETPLPVPVIKKFYAQPSVILSGQETTLYWEVTGQYDTLKLELGSVNNTVDVTGETDYKVSPTKDTKYTLVAYYGNNQNTFKKTLVTIGGTGEELLIYNWNGAVNQNTQGFPGYQPPVDNSDWTNPINFAEGTLYFYVEIVKMPADPKEMKLEYCFWQGGVSSGAEQCASKASLTGNPGTIVTWSDEVQKMWSKPERPYIDWTEPRREEAVAIKNSSGDPVSGLGDFNWGGDDPKEWYPFEWHFMAVIVEKGKAFSGWDNYLNAPPIPTPAAP